MAKVALPSREKAKASASFAFSPCPNANKAVSSVQRGNCLLFFPPARSLHFSASLSSAATPSFIGFPAKNESPD